MSATDRFDQPSGPLVKLVLVSALAACGGSAPPPAPPPAPSPAPVAAPPAPAAPVVAAPEDDSCPPEWQPGRDAHALAGLTFDRTYVKDTGDTRDSYVGRTECEKVVRCFEAIPKDQRSTIAVYEVVLEWPNSLYEAKEGGFGFGRAGFGPGGGGGGLPYPTTTDAAFSACVTAAIPAEHVSSLDGDRKVIRAIRFRVHAYTPPVADRYFTGTIGRGGSGSAPSYGRRNR